MSRSEVEMLKVEISSLRAELHGEANHIRAAEAVRTRPLTRHSAQWHLHAATY
jgi:hypothetical protein